MKLQEPETIGLYTRRATAALKKAIALNLATPLVGITAIYYYAFGLRDHRCTEVRTKAVEWTTKYNENTWDGIPVSVQAAQIQVCRPGRWPAVSERYNKRTNLCAYADDTHIICPYNIGYD